MGGRLTLNLNFGVSVESLIKIEAIAHVDILAAVLQ
jgi:hypothetical protein